MYDISHRKLGRFDGFFWFFCEILGDFLKKRLVTELSETAGNQASLKQKSSKIEQN